MIQVDMKMVVRIQFYSYLVNVESVCDRPSIKWVYQNQVYKIDTIT